MARKEEKRRPPGFSFFFLQSSKPSIPTKRPLRHSDISSCPTLFPLKPQPKHSRPPFFFLSSTFSRSSIFTVSRLSLKPNQSRHSAPPSLLLSSRDWKAPHFLLFSLEPIEKNTDDVPLILNLQHITPITFPTAAGHRPTVPSLSFPDLHSSTSHRPVVSIPSPP